MADVTLSDGRELTLDLFCFSMAELRAISGQDKDAEDALVARSAGLTVEQYVGLPYPDYWAVFNAWVEKVRQARTDPNSVRPSSSA